MSALANRTSVLLVATSVLLAQPAAAQPAPTEPTRPPVAESPAPAQPAPAQPAPAPAQPAPAPAQPAPAPAQPAAVVTPPADPGYSAPAYPPPVYPVAPGAPAAPAYPPAPAYPVPPAGYQAPADRTHRGGFSRLTLGVGLGYVGGGDIPPEPGFKPIDSVSHTSPVLGIAGQVGGGRRNLALAAELFYEQMLRRIENPSSVRFHLVGLGVAGSYYFDDDWFLTAHLRWVGLILWEASRPCFCDRFDSTGGPGVALTWGKEWFGDDDRGIGLGLHAAYARLRGTPELHYLTGQVLLTLTKF